MSTQVGLSDSDKYFSGCRSYYNKRLSATVFNVNAGDCFVSGSDEEVGITVLGSCVSACIRDPVAKIGGMNHFLLPSTKLDDGASMRYGAFAMEQLINEILKRGGKKECLEAKLFGGGNVINHNIRIGSKNSDFALEFMKKEGIKVVSADLQGNLPRRVHFYPTTGKVMIKRLEKANDRKNVLAEEDRYQAIIIKSGDTTGGDVELF
jgi:chemotaxis protein CheD